MIYSQNNLHILRESLRIFHPYLHFNVNDYAILDFLVKDRPNYMQLHSLEMKLRNLLCFFYWGYSGEISCYY